jgi:nucleoside-diphosphate-sugar epimerase
LGLKIRILVIGGRGFLGKEISLALTKAGFDVKVTTRSNFPVKNQLKLDVFSRNEVRTVLQSSAPEVVINCSWITEHSSYLHSDENHRYQSATVKLFEECKKMGVQHFIGLGSAAEYYNQNESDSAFSESQLGFTKYANAKRETLRDILMLNQDSAMIFNWLRIFQPYGPGQDPNRFLPTVIRSLLDELPVSIQSPNSVRDWVTTRDIGAAVLHLTKLRASGTVDIGTTVGITNLEICRKLGDIVKPQNMRFDVSDSQDQSSLVASSDNILFESGWTPIDDLSTGIHWVLRGN